MEKFKLQNNKLIYILVFLIVLPSFVIISFSSIVNLYEKRTLILNKLGYGNEHHNERRFLINPLKQSDRQIPPIDIKNLKINNDSEIENARTSISIYGNLVRSPTASFHRFILPIVFGIIVLALVDQVITKDKWDVKLTTPPTILLTFIFLQTGYHSQLEQISYLTYLDQIYLIGYLSCVLMLINAIISKGDWFKKRTNRIKRIKYTRNIRISFLFINIVLPFVLYLIF